MDKKILIFFILFGMILIKGVFISAYVCLETNNGDFCQEFENQNICEDNCVSSCVPLSLENIGGECELGYCYDSQTCSYNVAKKTCEELGGNWQNKLNNRPVECEEGCCVGYGLKTQGECNTLNGLFMPEIQNEQDCSLESRQNIKGACINQNSCSFTTRESCNGDFYENYLCSNPELNTNCEKQDHTGCVLDRDEVFWFDSCGNQENIYEGSSVLEKEHSWNNGRVLNKEDACVLGTSSNPLLNQGTCGNCDSLKGSVCGLKTSDEKLNDNSQNVVCRKTSCHDEIFNKERQNGESWCYYQGQFLPVNKSGQVITSPVTPGARSFLMYCINGEIYNTSCGDKRIKVCKESRVNNSNVAQCEPNFGDKCLGYNEDSNGVEECLENPDCYIKRVDGGLGRIPFKHLYRPFTPFSICVPKYPIGFYKDDDAEDCDLGTIKFFALNPEPVIEILNDFCMSLGDCGGSVNYIGEFGSDGYQIPGNFKKEYLDILKDYSKENLNEYIPYVDAGSLVAQSSGRFNLNQGSGKYQFICRKWSPPVGGDNCSLCGNDGFGCSRYACESLGTNCRLINENTKFERCASIPSDINPPQISFNPEYLPQEYSYASFENGIEIKSNESDKCIPEFTLLKIGIKLNEPGKCVFRVKKGVYSKESIVSGLSQDYSPADFGLSDFLGKTGSNTNEYDEFYLGGNKADLYNHTHRIFIPSLESLGVISFGQEKADFDIKIRCEDIDGHEDTKDYIIRACVKPTQDVNTPRINSYSPNKTKYNAENQKVFVYTNEPAECKWSKQDKDYQAMENQMYCENNITDYTYKGFRCNSTFPINYNENIFYIRCIDKPWETDLSKRNTMTESEVIQINKSGELKIDSISPNDNEEIKSGSEPAIAVVNVTTSGGADNGNAICYYKFGRWIAFRNTGEKTHSQILDTLTKGKKEIEIKCEDSVKNTAEAVSKFNIKIDNKAPEIIRIFKDDSGNLQIITDEDSKCYYDFKTCNFENNESRRMEIGLSKTHSVEWNPKLTYHIKCIDAWNNWKSRCSRIIKPGEF